MDAALPSDTPSGNWLRAEKSEGWMLKDHEKRIQLIEKELDKGKLLLTVIIVEIPLAAAVLGVVLKVMGHG